MLSLELWRLSTHLAFHICFPTQTPPPSRTSGISPTFALLAACSSPSIINQHLPVSSFCVLGFVPNPTRMSGKSSRYTSNLHTNWIIPANEGSVEGGDRAEASKGIANNNVLKATNNTASSRGDAPISTPKKSRYSTKFPSHWTVPETQPFDVNLDPAKQASSGRSKPLRYSGLPLPSVRPLRHIPTQYQPPNSTEWAPPPAPTEDKQFFGHESDYQRDNYQRDNNQHEQHSITGFSAYSLIRNTQRNTLESTSHVATVTVSPAVTSSTSSPYDGRDLPAAGPSVSPSYSVV